MVRTIEGSYDDDRTHQQTYQDVRQHMASVLLARSFGENDRLTSPGYIHGFNQDIQDSFLNRADETLRNMGIMDPTIRVVHGQAAEEAPIDSGTNAATA